MSLVDVTVQVPKALHDYCELLVVLSQDLMAKKDAATIATDLLPKLMLAAGEFNDLASDVKDAHMADAAGLLVSGLLKAFLPPKV